MSRIAGLVLAVLMALVAAFPAGAQVAAPAKTPTAVGSGGAAASVDPLATKAAIDVLRTGGNAVDAAVAAAGVLGVVEPYSSGIGGGGFMLIYDARRNRVDTIDSRETAPAAMPADAFIDKSTGAPFPFTEQRVSGLSVGVPGTVAGWERALKRYGTRKLRRLLRPAIRVADRGFVVDDTFASQTRDNKEIFKDFTSTRATYLKPDGSAPVAGDVFRNPDMADTLRIIARRGSRAFYRGAIARAIAETVRHPPVVPGAGRNVRPGVMAASDLVAYAAKRRRPTRVDYRGYEVFGMGPPSSGGSTVGEALNILEGFDLGGDRSEAMHRYLEASRYAYADRNVFLADPGFFKVPLRGLLSDGYAAERRGLIGPGAGPAGAAPGNPYPFSRGPQARTRPGEEQGRSTTHLTVTDRYGNIVSYTFTIEQTGGSGMVVPGRGFLLNNELTDFNVDSTTHPNAVGPGKRPRSSIAPTIIFRHGRPVLALGSPGGATIITTVLQTIVNHLDFKMPLPEAVAEPRGSQRNAASGTTEAEPAFVLKYGPGLTPRGYRFSNPTGGEIGAATAIRLRLDGNAQAVAEPKRRGGGSAMVVNPG
jgi:gamma-glutamyltranspeptidase/glutathione hydrolase